MLALNDISGHKATDTVPAVLTVRSFSRSHTSHVWRAGPSNGSRLQVDRAWCTERPEPAEGVGETTRTR